MIARLWSARTTPAQAPGYAEHLRSHVLPAVRSLEGYRGAQLLEREVEGSIEILVLTFWESLDSVRGFAGTDLDHAVVAKEAAALLTRYDDRVQHYEVVLRDEAAGVDQTSEAQTSRE
jgi:heme-degrading monooxygenase HmoA